jgi:VWFA-related protein
MPVALLLAVALTAQTKFGTSVEVRVVNVDVVVTDKAGNRVTGLTKDDFEITEDGKGQKITNFYEGVAAAAKPALSVAEGAAVTTLPATPRPRRFVIFIDNESMHPAVRTRFFSGVRKFVEEHVRSGDQTSLVSWSRSGLQIAAPLTEEKSVLLAAINAVEAAPSPNSILSSYEHVRQQCIRAKDYVRSGRLPMASAYADCINIVRQETMVLMNDSRLLMNAINVAMSVTAGAEGKKVLVLAGASLPQQPGWELYRFANTIFAAMQTNFASAPAEQTPGGDMKQQREMVEKLARSANAQGVSLYTINAPVATDLTDIRSKSGEGDFGTDFLRIGNTEDAYGTLSSMTGGVSYLKPKNFEVALAAIAGDLDAYYSIGYRPPDDIGRDRAIVVRTRNRNYTVRARQSYAPKTAEEQMSDRVIANIFTPSKSEWPVTIRVGTPRPADKGSFTVPIEISMPPALTLLPQADAKLGGGWTTYIAVGTKQGVLSTLSRSPQEVAVPAAEESNFRKVPLTFGATLTLKGGENLVSIAVVDQVSNVAGFARTTIITPRDGLSLSP